jgi:acetyl/propionyl-CoA carboxylase alpha subunit
MSLPTVTTNRGFLATLLEDEEVRRGDARTDTIERVSHPDPATPSHAWEAAARTLADVTSSDRETRWTTSRPGFRLNAKARLSIRSGTTQRAVEISRAPAFPTEVESRLGERMRDRDVYDQQIGVDVDGRWLRFQLAPPPTVETALEHAAAAGGGASRVVAPMPGTVLAVRVAEGDVVEAHQVLVVLEAMKMENGVTAPADGRVTNVRVTEGQQVQRDDILVELE